MSRTGTTAWPEAIHEALPPAGAPEAEALRRRLLDVLLSPAEPPRMSYEEFLAWADEDTLAEWVDGEVIMMSPASKRHQDIVGMLYEVLRRYVQARRLGEVIQAPFQMKLEHGREPDLIFVANKHLDRLKETYLDGPADLVMEVVSPGPDNVERDRGKKFYEYEQGGVSEYWVIDPQVRRAEAYCLRKGVYRLAFSGENGIYRSEALPGFWLRVEWLWQEPLPDVARITWEIVGLEALRRLLAELEQEEAAREARQAEGKR